MSPRFACVGFLAVCVFILTASPWVSLAAFVVLSIIFPS